VYIAPDLINKHKKQKNMEALFVTKTGDRSGSKDGKEWRVSNFLIETKGKYPNNGKWYNTIKCFKLELLNAKVAPKKAAKAAKSVVVEEEEGTDDLPF